VVAKFEFPPVAQSYEGKVRVRDTDGAGYIVYIGDVELHDIRDDLVYAEGKRVRLVIEEVKRKKKKEVPHAND
jgi:hypothetical protein